MPLLLALLLLGCSFDTPAPAPDVREWSRAERVVLYRPHFDLQPEPYHGLSCPSQPLRLYGFETRSRHASAALLVRVHGPIDPLRDKAPVLYRDVSVRLSRRWLAGRFTDLPESSAWQVRTDTAGAALLHVPNGIYELDIRDFSPLGRGIIQVRPGAQDSLRCTFGRAALAEAHAEAPGAGGVVERTATTIVLATLVAQSQPPPA